LTDPAADFALGVKALEQQNASDAIGAFEALADQGVIDAHASFDRGLAYALRVRLGGEVPGDLGRAVHAFEEARDLADDAETKEAAAHALSILRAEIARRRARAGESAVVEQSPRPDVAIARALSEQAWSWLAISASFALALALAVRIRSTTRRLRVGATVALALAALVLASSMGAAALRKHERNALEEAVIVVPAARPADASGLAKQGAAPLPEGARLEIIEWHGGLAHVRWGSSDVGWLPASSLRVLARAP
jgi:hypothetical protein